MSYYTIDPDGVIEAESKVQPEHLPLVSCNDWRWVFEDKDGARSIDIWALAEYQIERSGDLIPEDASFCLDADLDLVDRRRGPFYESEISLLCSYFKKEHLLKALGIRRGLWLEEVGQLKYLCDDRYLPTEESDCHVLYEPTDGAVASILLERADVALPNWRGFDPESGRVVSERKQRREPDKKLILAIRLFEINWADTAPGYSWPDAYHAAYVPFVDMIAVTTSADTDVTFGFADLVIGSFDIGLDFDENVAQIIRDTWAIHKAEWEQEPWAYLLSADWIPRETLLDWRKDVWERGWPDIIKEDEDEQE